MNIHSKGIRHVIEAQQFDLPTLEQIFDLADTLRNSGDSCMAGKIMATLFYEPSTRTRFSFESAMSRLGGLPTLSSESAGIFSSAAKGETLEDTIRVTSAYANIIVLRHDEKEELHTAERAAKVSGVPVINAGCGKSQHPTQMLLDLYTILHERRTIDGTTIAIVGDLKNGRTVRSLCYMLAKFEAIRVYFISPPSLRIESDIVDYLNRHNVSHEIAPSLSQVIDSVDVVYMTRVQRERMPSLSDIDFKRLQQSYRLNEQLAREMRRGAIIMHPLPRNEELAPEVDQLPQAAYFRQAENGLYVRMALLKWIFMK